MILNLGLLKVSKMAYKYDLSKVLKMSSLRISFKRAIIVKYQKRTIIKMSFFVHIIKMSNSLKDSGLSIVDLKAIAKVRDIKSYESMKVSY